MQESIENIRENYVSKVDLREQIDVMKDCRRSPSSDENVKSKPRCTSQYIFNDSMYKETNTLNKENNLPTSTQNSNDMSLSSGMVNKPDFTNNQQRSLNDDNNLKINKNTQSNLTGSEETTTYKPTTETTQKLSFAEVASTDTESKQPVQPGEWITVQKRRLKNKTYTKGGVGMAEPENSEKFKAADTKIGLFISNVHRDVSEQDIANYVYKNTGETVSLVKIKMKREKDYNAYKVLVARSKMELFLNMNLWPSGITFRRFMNYRERQFNEDCLALAEAC